MWSRLLTVALLLLPVPALADVKEKVAALAPSGLVLVVAFDELLHATAAKAATSIATTAAVVRRRGVPVGPAAVPGAMSSPSEVDRKPFRPIRKSRLRLSATVGARTVPVNP